MRLATFAVLLVAAAGCRGPGTMQRMCPEGYTDCGGDCVLLENDSRHCGACNNACAATEECSASMCIPKCPAGQHACNGVCVSNSDVATCGNRCTPCPMPAGSVATCDGMSCGLICGLQQRACGSTCADCPPNTGTKCVGETCVSSGCPEGQHLCNGQCVDENGGSCGDACLVCPAPASNAFQVCLNGGCEFLCRPGNRSCATGCCSADFMQVGNFHSCQLTPAGSVMCWGRNHVDVAMTTGGALGNGTYTNRAQPVPVAGLGSGTVALQLGSFHSCAMDQFGAVFCWGHALGGRLGEGTSSDKLIPTAVTGLGQGSSTAITAGDSGGCALSRKGEVRCWGENTHGEAGDGTKTPRTTPAMIPELGTTAIDVAMGGGHACAVLRGGTVRCWGDNARGQLGDGSMMERLKPVLAVGLSDAVRVSCGAESTCALRKNGEVSCWGTGVTVPAKVDGLSGIVEVTAGGSHACALGNSGQIFCWGANDSGQLGDGTKAPHGAPLPVTGITDGTSVSAGFAHTCARTRSGTRCWGNNQYGQLGDGTTMERLIPVSTN